MTTEPKYKFTVTIDDGWTVHQYVYGYASGGLSISDLDRAILIAYPQLRPLVSRYLGPVQKCPPTQSSPSSPPTAPAQSAAGPAIPSTGAPPAEFGQLSGVQLRLLDQYLLDPVHRSNLSSYAIVCIIYMLWKIVRPGAMKAAGISTCPATKPQSDSANNASK